MLQELDCVNERCQALEKEVQTATEKSSQLENGVEKALTAVDGKYLDMLQEIRSTALSQKAYL